MVRAQKKYMLDKREYNIFQEPLRVWKTAEQCLESSEKNNLECRTYENYQIGGQNKDILRHTRTQSIYLNLFTLSVELFEDMDK